MKLSQQHTDNADFTDLHGQISQYFLYAFDYQHISNPFLSALSVLSVC